MLHVHDLAVYLVIMPQHCQDLDAEVTFHKDRAVILGVRETPWERLSASLVFAYLRA